MTHFARVSLLAASTLALALSAIGCEVQCDENDETQGTTCIAKSLKKFEGTPTTKQAAWVSGGTVTIEGVNGKIDVVRGSAGLVSATFTPFDYRAHDTPEADVVADIGTLSLTVEGDVGGVSGATRVKSAKGAASTTGADVSVSIPPEFDGKLVVRQNNGETVIAFVGSASGVDLVSDNGGCSVTGSATQATFVVNCDNGGIDASLSGVPAGASGTITSGNGDVNLHIPGSAKFFVQGTTGSTGMVDVGNAVAAGCAVLEATPPSDQARTVTCGSAVAGDAQYVVGAPDLGDIHLSF